MFIIQVINSIGMLLIINNYFYTKYPLKYQEYIGLASYNIIRIYSVLEMYCTKGITFINFGTIYKKSDRYVPKLELINNGKICNTLTIHNAAEQLNTETIFVYSDISNNSKCINKKIYQKFPTSLKYEESLVQFMLIEILVNNNIYMVNLKNDLYNYYVVDNIFDKNFFMYYLKNHTTYQDIDFDKEEEIIINILDHNVTKVNINIMNNESIRITINDYVINK